MSLSSFPSVPRRIVSDPQVLGGRWHVADTTVAVGEVSLDHATNGCHAGYTYPSLSRAELAACLVFDFPPTRESGVAMLAGTVVVSCACGEDISAAGGLDEPVHCVCGRVWRLRLLLNLVQDGGIAVRDTAVGAVFLPAAP